MHPDKVKSEAKKEDEKFADYNCNKCRNCCKMYKGSIPVKISLYRSARAVLEFAECIGNSRHTRSYLSKSICTNFFPLGNICSKVLIG